MPVRSSFARTLWTFTVGGLILNFVVDMVFTICQIVWVDFIHYNPHRSQSDALDLMILSPIAALVAMLVFSVPVIVGTIVAMVSHRIWGRVPFYSLVVMVPLCGFVTYMMAPYMLVPASPYESDYKDFIWFSLRQLPVLVGCWLWSNRIPKS